MNSDSTPTVGGSLRSAVEKIAAGNSRDAFLAHCHRVAIEVGTWPEWKQRVLGTIRSPDDAPTPESAP